jgi:hypothetical protein
MPGPELHSIQGRITGSANHGDDSCRLRTNSSFPFGDDVRPPQPMTPKLEARGIGIIAEKEGATPGMSCRAPHINFKLFGKEDSPPVQPVLFGAVGSMPMLDGFCTYGPTNHLITSGR